MISKIAEIIWKNGKILSSSLEVPLTLYNNFNSLRTDSSMFKETGCYIVLFNNRVFRVYVKVTAESQKLHHSGYQKCMIATGYDEIKF